MPGGEEEELQDPESRNVLGKCQRKEQALPKLQCHRQEVGTIPKPGTSRCSWVPFTLPWNGLRERESPFWSKDKSKEVV